MTSIKNQLYFFIVFAILFSCKAIESDAPSQMVQVFPPAEQPLSTISVPISLRLNPYYQLAEAQIDKKFKGESSPCEGVSFSYVYEREPFTWEGRNQQIIIGLNGKYSLDMSYCAKCTSLFSDNGNCAVPRIPFSCGIGEPMRRMHTEFTSTFELTENYGIKTSTKVTDLKAIDPCKVTVFQYNATDELMKEMRTTLDKTALDMDRDLSKINFKKQAQEAWDQASKPIEIPGYGFLHFNPKTLSLVTPSLKNDVLKSQFEIVAQPVFSTQKEITKKTIVPDLITKKHSNNDSLSVYLDLKLDYDSLTNLIQKYAQGQRIDLDKKRHVILDSIQIFGAKNEQLLLRVRFSGSKKGVLYLLGTPVIEPVSQLLTFENLDYEIETKSMLLKTAKWMFDNRILAAFQKASTQDLKPFMIEAKNNINSKFVYTFDAYTLKGKISSMTVENVFPNSDFLWIRTYCTGKTLLSN